MSRQRIIWFGLSLATAMVLVLAASCGDKNSPAPPALNTDGGSDRDGGLDGGTDGGTDGGSDGGTDGGTDAGVVHFPDAGGWQFYGPQQGGPREVFGVTSDPNGNVWVAGGEDGLFLLKPGASNFQKYTMADGLRPYGYLPDGGTPIGEKHMKVLSVAGGPPNSVFVGYEGKPVGPGQHDCEANWYYPNDPGGRDPNIYKSGDSDRVTLVAGDRISVVHYDIFTGPGILPGDEALGREKLCTILRIAYHAGTHSVWFGANHGFAWGDSNYPGDPTCGGQYHCSGVIEHAHPAINAFADEQRRVVILLTGDYYGMSPDSIGDVWIGGANRSAKFRYATLQRNFFAAGEEMECGSPECISRRLDIWPDRVAEPEYPRPSDRVDDNVSDMAAVPDGSVWIGSWSNGLAHYKPGQPTEYRVDTTVDFRGNVAGLELDPQDASLWIGYLSGGLARLRGNQYIPLDYHVLGMDLVQGYIPDIQSDTYGGRRRILVAFHGGGGRPGAIGIYTGD